MASDPPVPDFIRNFFQMEAKANDEKAGFAWTMFAALKKQVTEFQAGLTQNEETAAWLANFGSSMTLTITNIGYRHPHLIVLVGENDKGLRCELLQHVSQVSLLLVAVPVKPGEQPRRIGFQLPEKSQSDE